MTNLEQKRYAQTSQNMNQLPLLKTAAQERYFYSHQNWYPVPSDGPTVVDWGWTTGAGAFLAAFNSLPQSPICGL